MSEPTGPQTPGTPDSPRSPRSAEDAPEAAGQAAPRGAAPHEPAASGPMIRDKRRIDPVTGAPRNPVNGSPVQGDGSPVQGDGSPAQGDGSPAQGDGSPAQGDSPRDPVHGAKVSELEEMVAERTADLQRLQAEYSNYKKRVDRDRGLAKTAGIEAVVLDLLPVLDSIEAAREHEELVGGFRLVADELEKVSGKYGLEVFGEVGDVFDPHVHEALMHMPYEGEITETTISAVIQKGVKLNDRVLRPARVAVADPS